MDITVNMERFDYSVKRIKCDQSGGMGAPGYGVSIFYDKYLRRYEYIYVKL